MTPVAASSAYAESRPSLDAAAQVIIIVEGRSAGRA